MERTAVPAGSPTAAPRADWRGLVARYHTPSRGRSLRQLSVTLAALSARIDSITQHLAVASRNFDTADFVGALKCGGFRTAGGECQAGEYQH